MEIEKKNDNKKWNNFPNHELTKMSDEKKQMRQNNQKSIEYDNFKRWSSNWNENGQHGMQLTSHRSDLLEEEINNHIINNNNNNNKLSSSYWNWNKSK